MESTQPKGRYNARSGSEFGRLFSDLVLGSRPGTTEGQGLARSPARALTRSFEWRVMTGKNIVNVLLRKSGDDDATAICP